MHRQLTEIQKYNMKNPSKEDRKKLMKKLFDESDDEYNITNKKQKMESKVSIMCLNFNIMLNINYYSIYYFLYVYILDFYRLTNNPK